MTETFTVDILHRHAFGSLAHVCDVADCGKAFGTLAEVIAHERTHSDSATSGQPEPTTNVPFGPESPSAEG